MKYTRFLAGMVLAIVFVSPAFADGDNERYTSLVLEVPATWHTEYGKSALTGVHGVSIVATGCNPTPGCRTMGISFFGLGLSQNRAREIWNKGADRKFSFSLTMLEPGIILPLHENWQRGFLSLSALLGQAISSERTKRGARVDGAAYGVRLGLTVPVSKSMVATVSTRAIGSPLRDFQDLFGTYIVVSSLGLGMQF